MEHVFNAQIGQVEFSSPDDVSDVINAWVSEKTEGKIEKMFENGLAEDTAAILLNVIYFKGEWLNKFPESETKKMPFHVDTEKTVEIDFMTVTAQFAYSELEGAKAIKIPYKVRWLPHSWTGRPILVVYKSHANFPKVNTTSFIILK